MFCFFLHTFLGCNIDIDKPVGALQVPNFWEPGDRYPSDLTCTWTLTGGQLAGRGLDVNFILVELDADPRTDSRLAQNKSQDYITVIILQEYLQNNCHIFLISLLIIFPLNCVIILMFKPTSDQIWD